MRLTQGLLRAELARRIGTSRPELTAGLDLSTGAGLATAYAKATTPVAAELMAVAVLRRFDLASFVRGACVFAAGIAPEEARAWRRSFTRTVFLTGNPENLRDRFAFDHVTGDGQAAWLGPLPPARLTALRRLLPLHHAPREPRAVPVPVVELPATPAARPHRPPVRRALYFATAGATVADCLVHLNHLLAEAVLDGLLMPGDSLTVRPVPRLVGVVEPLVALRIGLDPTAPDRLRAHAGLTAGTARRVVNDAEQGASP